MLGSKKTLVALALAVLAVPALAALAQTRNDGGVHVVEGATTAPGTSPAWAADKRFLVGEADDVFVGRVVRAEDRLSVSETSTPPSPESQFAVEVGRTIKGGLSCTVTVNQGGGYVEYAADRDYPEEGVEKGQTVRQLVVLEETPPLEVGREYMFVTTYDRDNGWHEMVGTGRTSSVEVKGQAQREGSCVGKLRAGEAQSGGSPRRLLRAAGAAAVGALRRRPQSASAPRTLPRAAVGPAPW